MGGQADLGDVQALIRLAEAVGAAAFLAKRSLAEAEAETMPRLRSLERRVSAAAAELRRAEAAASRADDDDRAELDQYVREARRHHDRLRQAAARVQDALSRYKAASREVRSLDQAVLGPAQDFLRRKVDEVRVYLATGLDGRGAAAHARCSSASQGPAAVGNPWGQDLPELPEGMAWIPIQSIVVQLADALPEVWDGDATREEMEIGLRTFAEELVPRLRDGPLDREELLALDVAEGRLPGGLVRPDTRHNLVDIFFGKSAIAVQHLSSGRYTVINGRHRTEVARSLGWTHVPAMLASP